MDKEYLMGVFIFASRIFATNLLQLGMYKAHLL